MNHVHPPVASSSRSEMASQFTAYVQRPGFPCVGARSAFNKGRVRFGDYGRLGTANAPEICADLLAFSREFPSPGLVPVTFIAMFGGAFATEAEFARGMWAQLRAVHAYDELQFEWDATVSADPESPEFSFSVAGRAFFVVGLNPAASRLARRAPMPCLVFNLHDQFQSLRSSGKYQGMQHVIRDRDIALQGSINPSLAGFGEKSEARQYSGIAHPAQWKCPFRQGEPGVRSDAA